MKRKHYFGIIVMCILLGAFALGSLAVHAEETGAVTINPVDYGADPTGQNDSAEAVWQAFEAAKEATANGLTLQLNFRKGNIIFIKTGFSRENIIRLTRTVLKILRNGLDC